MNVNKVLKCLEFQQSKGRRESEVFPHGTYEVKNFILETSVGLYSVIKGISEIRLLERLSEVIRKF